MRLFVVLSALVSFVAAGSVIETRNVPPKLDPPPGCAQLPSGTINVRWDSTYDLPASFYATVTVVKPNSHPVLGGRVGCNSVQEPDTLGRSSFDGAHDNQYPSTVNCCQPPDQHRDCDNIVPYL
ncbi:hypothetical protein EXIGLDRAFT_840529 [Exidia glandulosa HHB12029]|uniref:Fibronectin type-III domain-containing protein n=1 Tax=Exidia glandulosa HHB12029 TaxID=1314781 RepID=A0A165EDS7_EXIGL|nr:hypothetical protein EXIGLDRAFT_840529 [Exidia glandulosa HHB12029]